MSRHSRRRRWPRAVLLAVAGMAAGVAAGALLVPARHAALDEAGAAGKNRGSERAGSAKTVRYAEGQILVKFKDGTPPAIRSSILARAGAKSKRKVEKLGVDVVEVEDARTGEALAALKSSPWVEVAERDVVLESLDTVPSDPLWSGQWGLAKIAAPKAWDVTQGSSGVVIAVLDSGVAAHADLGPLVTGYDIVNDDPDPADDHGHGTAVAGVIAAHTNNGKGIAGTCWTCSLMPVKVLGADGSGTTSSVARGIVWAANEGARVINMSLGGVGTTQTLTDAVVYAANKGVVLVAAAGNAGSTTPFYPAAYPDVIAVAATTSSDALYDWSNRGSWVQVAAPGCNTAPALSGAYESFCGTSSAAPVVAGIVGLGLSARPATTRGEIEDALRAAARPVAGSDEHGRVDAAGTLAALGLSSPAIARPAVTAAPAVTGTPRVGSTLTASTGTWSGAPTGYAYRWLRCDTRGESCVRIDGATARGYVVREADANRTLRVDVTATSSGGAATARSAPTSLVILPPPANTSLPIVSGTARVGETLAVNRGAWSYSPTRFSYQWRRCDTSGTRCSAITEAMSRSYVVTAANRRFTLRVVVTASNTGGSTSAISEPTALISATTSYTPASVDELRTALVARINRLRTARGVRQLRVVSPLASAATRHARSIARLGYFKHDLWTPSRSPQWTPFTTWIRWYYPARGYSTWKAGENLAYAAGTLTADAVVRQWLNSSTHRAVLLDRVWRQLGVAAYRMQAPVGTFRGMDEVVVVAAEFGRRS